MALPTLDLLGPIDAGFWLNETPASPLHIGYVGVGSGPPPSFGELVQHVEHRLHLLPRHRQRIRAVPLGLTRPFWIDDATFDIMRHVRHHRATAPVVDPLELTGEILGQPLDLTRPPWELWLVDGFDELSFLIVVKFHHCLMDAVGMVRLAHALFDGSRSASQEVASDWQPAPAPSDIAVLGALAQNLLQAGARKVSSVLRGEVRFGTMRQTLSTLGKVVAGSRREQREPAPATALNPEIGPRRRLISIDLPLNRARDVQAQWNVTVNDVILAVSMGAVSALLKRLDPGAPMPTLHVHVPVSLRADDEGTAPAPGNRITVIAARLSCEPMTAPERLQQIAQTMRRYKTSDAGTVVAVVDRISGLLPVSVLRRMSRRHFTSDAYNLIVTNIPGPSDTYLMGRRGERIVPLAFLAPGHALTIAVLSYREQLTFGLLADPEVIPDLERVGTDMLAEFDALIHERKPSDQRRPLAPPGSTDP